MGQERRLTAGDWAQAALAAIADGGLTAVAVEPLAKQLGATKGSFYWHFANREALVDAALRLWETKGTEDVIAAMEAEPDPHARLRRLFGLTIGAARANPTEVRLFAAADNPQVGPVVRRVTRRRIDYVTQLYAKIGFASEPARRRGLLAVSVYLGHLQLGHALPEVLPRGELELQRYLDDPLTALLRLD